MLIVFYENSIDAISRCFITSRSFLLCVLILFRPLLTVFTLNRYVFHIHFFALRSLFYSTVLNPGGFITNPNTTEQVFLFLSTCLVFASFLLKGKLFKFLLNRVGLTVHLHMVSVCLLYLNVLVLHNYFH